jgi:hypothetical protein
MSAPVTAERFVARKILALSILYLIFRTKARTNQEQKRYQSRLWRMAQRLTQHLRFDGVRAAICSGLASWRNTRTAGAGVG